MAATEQTTASVIGSGNMGTAIAQLFEEGGAQVQRVGHASDEGITGELVVLAVPWPALDDIVKRLGDQLAGRIVVDITNPLDFDTFDRLLVPAGSSAAAQLQDALPQSRVLKAFNTNFSGTLSAKQVGPNTTTVLVAGDDAAAKKTLVDVLTAAGVDAIDAGSLSRAHELEALGFLQLSLANASQIGWSAGFGVVR